MALATPSTPAPNADWKRKLNLDRTNARRASRVDNSEDDTEEDTMDAPMQRTNPRFRDLMANAGTPRTEPLAQTPNKITEPQTEPLSSEPTEAEEAPDQNTEPQTGGDSPNPENGKSGSEKPNQLQSASDILANDQSANKTGSGISTGLEGKEDKPATPPASPKEDAKSQMNKDSLPASTPKSNSDQGNAKTNPDKKEGPPAGNQASAQENQTKRELDRDTKKNKSETKPDKKEGPAALDGLMKTKPKGLAGTLLRLVKMPSTITGKIGTFIRLGLVAAGEGGVVVGIVDEIVGEKDTDKILTFTLVGLVLLAVLVPTIIIIVLVSIINNLIAAFS